MDDAAPTSDARNGALRREVGAAGAVMLGLGSILGTGVYVSIGLGAGIAGPAVIVAIVIAAAVAACNGLSSAQLAAAHPVSGGTYEYGYRRLNPSLGFAAGWMFLCAKSASAATAALGFSGYLLVAIGRGGAGLPMRITIGLAIVLLVTLLILGGIRRTSAFNVFVVSITLLALLVFIIAGARPAAHGAAEHLSPFFLAGGEEASGVWEISRGLLHASALMFVAYTGYGRIATLGEEVVDPGRTIPRSIIVTLIVSMLIYLGVATIAVACVGATRYAEMTDESAAPLELIAREAFAFPALGWVLAIGAITAMLGVLLNLILGLSRVLLAMGRRGDMPRATARLTSSRSPAIAIVVMSLVIAALVLVGDVKTTWSFSAFTVLVYYAITNLAALRLKGSERLYPRWIAAAGLIACLSLAFFVEREIWVIGLGILALGMAWRLVAARIAQKRP